MTTIIDRAGRWRDAVVSAEATIHDVIRNLDAVAIQIVLVAGDDGVLLGTISDGDVRRGLLKGLTLEGSIGSIIHHNPLVVPRTMDRELVLELMQANRVRQVPIVDAENKVVGIHLWDQLSAPTARSNVMVIMAGGKGTRLLPHTETCPKPMLEVGGKPMLEHIIERAKRDGFQRFILAIHYLGHMIEGHFGTGERFGVEISYLREEQPLGTAGALSLLDPLPAEPFVVTNGDVITDIHYGELLEFHMRHAAMATMAVRLHEWQHPFGVVQMQGVDIVGFEEKPIARSHINAGVYAIDPTALQCMRPGEACDMPMLFERLQSQKRRTVAYPMHEPWLDVGRSEDLTRAQGLLADKE